MNWLQFLTMVTGLYLLYYLVVILMDYLKAGNTDKQAGKSTVLTFSQTVAPEKPDLKDFEVVSVPKAMAAEAAPPAAPPVTATGGVLLKNMFQLARTESIEWTSQVSY